MSEETAWTSEYDRTSETLRWLRDKRRGHRSSRNRDLGVIGYSLVLLAGGYGTTFVYRFAKRLEHAAAQGDNLEAIRRALPAGLVLLALSLAVIAARDALWRGPVIVPGPDAAWLLSQPVDRTRVLRPYFRLTAGLAVAGGVLCAVAGSVLLRLTGLSSLAAGLAGCLPAGLCLPLLAVVLALQVERRTSLGVRVRAWTPYAVLLLVVLVAQTGWAAAGHRLPVLEQIELWSGPWGWAAQPVVHAAGGSASAWPAAVALLVVLTAAATRYAHTASATVPTRQLRARAATAATVASVLWSVELRAAKLAVSEALGRDGRKARRRLPMPRSKYLVVMWRDAVALLRAPGLVGSAALWTAAAAAIAGLAASLDGRSRTAAVVMALTLGYLAVGRLTESARLEADDLRRSSWSPFRFATVMLHHAIVPAALGAVLACLAAVPFALNGGIWALVLMPVCALPFAAASVLAAVRGPVRSELLFIGIPTPFGDLSFFVFLFWYAAPLLISVTALSFALEAVLAHGAGIDALACMVLVALALTAVLLLGASHLAKKLRRH
ncbi:DUF6297 family protein [Streptomyces platensis]|uniref:DUF6297 family protein n=1 Tax=Streptomyces platensis TaxID=58346 RepID=UPI002E81B7CE|nr:DUF6297 family protein [Streptomyces platensis]WUB83759.1 DUF6297 family protein [Streptomyces platensis]